MSGIATAIGGAAVVGYLGAQKAGNTQAAGQRLAAQTQTHMFDTVVGQEQPFLNAGYGATGALSNLLGTGTGKRGGIDPATGLPIGYLTQQFNPTQQQLDQYPGYQFALKTGGQAVQEC